MENETPTLGNRFPKWKIEPQLWEATFHFGKRNPPQVTYPSDVFEHLAEYGMLNTDLFEEVHPINYGK